MKNQLNLYIFTLVVSHNALEVILFRKITYYYLEVSHVSKGSFESHVTYLHV
jgi:hypothetical protein